MASNGETPSPEAGGTYEEEIILPYSTTVKNAPMVAGGKVAVRHLSPIMCNTFNVRPAGRQYNFEFSYLDVVLPFGSINEEEGSGRLPLNFDTLETVPHTVVSIPVEHAFNFYAKLGDFLNEQINKMTPDLKAHVLKTAFPANPVWHYQALNKREKSD